MGTAGGWELGRRLLVIALAGFVAGLGLRASAVSRLAEAAELGPPSSLDTLRLGHALRGDEARREIRRLHGKRIPFEDAVVAHYEGPAGVVMLYISEARDAITAQRQIEKMTELIRNGGGPFTHLRERMHDGVAVFSTLGQGQVHYYFRLGTRVIWVAADAMVARRALADALRYYR